MHKGLLLFFLFGCLSSLLIAQTGTEKYTEDKPDRIAVFYLHCKDLDASKRLSSTTLDAYFFGDPTTHTETDAEGYPYIKGEGSPIANFWQANFNGIYHYKGKVYSVQLPFTEEEFSIMGKKSLARKLGEKLKGPMERLEAEEARMGYEDYRLFYEKKFFEALAANEEYEEDVSLDDIKRNLKRQQDELRAIKEKLVLAGVQLDAEEELRLLNEEVRLLQEQQRLEGTIAPAEKVNQIIAQQEAFEAQKIALETQKETVVEPTLIAGGFNAEKFDKILYIIQENSEYSTGKYIIEYIGQDGAPSIKVNGLEVIKPAISCHPIDQGDLTASATDPDANPLHYRPEEFNFWGSRGAYSIFHEWGHSFDLYHAEMPCADEECIKDYTSACPDYFQFDCSAKESENTWNHTSIIYGNKYDIMGSRLAYSMLFSAAMRDKAGMLPDKERILLPSHATKLFKRIKLVPYQQQGPLENRTFRAAKVSIEHYAPMPLMADIPEKEGFEFRPSAKVRLYLENRRAVSYDNNLQSDGLISNTKGLMVTLALEEVDMLVISQGGNSEAEIDGAKALAASKENDYDTNTWLLDMSPQDGSASVTLNPGWEFYHKDWVVSIQDVHFNAEGNIEFDVGFEKKGALASNVYKTILFANETIASFDAPILYSSGLDYYLQLENGELKIRQTANPNNITWRGSEENIPVNSAIDRLNFNDGNLVLSARGVTVANKGVAGHSDARLIVTGDGKLKIVDGRGTETWPNLGNHEATTDPAGNTYQVKRMNDGKLWLTENLKLNTAKGSYCHNDDDQLCDLYGRFYTFEAAKEACASLPGNWRLPTDVEWKELAEAYGGRAQANYALKEGGGSGFNAKLGGHRWTLNNWYSTEFYGEYWSSTARQEDNIHAWFYKFSRKNESSILQYNHRQAARSVRCVRD